MKHLTQTVVIVLLLVGAVAWAADDQAPQTGIHPIGGLAFADEIELTVVNVLVYVTDKKGMAVTDLTAEDFQIVQDGEAKVISNFDLYTGDVQRHAIEAVPSFGPTPTPAPDQPKALEPRPVYMIIYVDNDNLRPMDRNRILRQIRPFISEHLYPPVQMMVVTYQKSLDVVVPFTSDKSEIMSGLRSVVMQTGARQSRDSARKDLLDKMRRHRQDAGASQVNSYHAVHAQMIAYAEEEANDLAFTISALRQVVTTMSGLPGKKSVLYLSNGLPMIAGLELFYAFANTFDNPSVITQSAVYDQTRKFKSLVAAANAQDVSFYTVGAGGLQHTGMSTAEYAGPQDTISASIGDSNYMDSLRFIAKRTGGAAILNTNDITEGLVKVSQDFFTYYSLGYQLNSSGADKVHEIKVTLKNHPDYTVRYRRRFVEKSIETKVQDTVITGLMFPIDDNPMQLDLSVGTAAPAAGGRWIVPFELTFPLRKIALLPVGEDYVGRAVLFIGARDKEGRQSDLVRQEHEIRIPMEVYEKSQRERFSITASLLMESGRFTIVAGLLDPITRQSSYQTVKTTIGGE